MKRRLEQYVRATVDYYPGIFTKEGADIWFDALKKEIIWEVKLSHSIYAVADKGVTFVYSGEEKITGPWNDDLLWIKKRVEDELGETFNCVLLTYFEDGFDYIDWHSDDENDLVPGSSIASVSFGAPRKFLFRVKSSKLKNTVTLRHGSLLVMRNQTQKHYQQSFPKQLKIENGRISLTFRNIRQ